MNSIGRKGEDIASQFLRKKGYKIIGRNYKTNLGEIDIIAKDADTIVFIEVKTRADNSFAHPFESVHAKKRQKLKNLALLYMKKQKKEFPARFDVLSIVLKANGPHEIEHIKDAFEV